MQVETAARLDSWHLQGASAICIIICIISSHIYIYIYDDMMSILYIIRDYDDDERYYTALVYIIIILHSIDMMAEF